MFIEVVVKINSNFQKHIKDCYNALGITAAAITVIARLAYPLNGSSQNTVDIPKSENEQSAMAAKKIM